ncbi:MAG: methionine--tRNA ligase, partial [Planctomycetota bacterium]|nr:methionine--tRNA ligase [Planctomycetota bacterium]
LDEADPVIAAAADLCDSPAALMAECAFGAYIDKIRLLTAATNRFIDDTAPFKLAKADPEGQRLKSVLYTCAEAVRLVLLHLEPIMPEAVAAGYEQLGWKPTGPAGESARWGVLPPGAVVRKGQGLFPRKESV